MRSILLLITFLPAVSAEAGEFKCQTTLPPSINGPFFAGDGDTIYSPASARGIRLWGIQAPELRDSQHAETEAGMRSRAYLHDLLAAADNIGVCSPLKFDRYCRVVAICKAGGTDLGMAMIDAGVAYTYYLAEVPPQQMELASSYSRAEQRARKKQKGLWPVWLAERQMAVQGR